MTKVTLDDALQAKFSGVDEAELCDRSGKSVGHVLSERLSRRLLYDWANAQVTDEELERRRRQPGGCPLTEVWARLEQQ